MALFKYCGGIILIYLRDFTAQIQTASSKSCPWGASRSPFFISGHGLPRGALGLQVMLGHEELHSPHLFLLDYSSGGFCLVSGLCTPLRTGPGKRGVSWELLSREGWDLVSGLVAAGPNTGLDVALLP